MFKELATIPHVVLGVAGIIAAFWAAIEAVNCLEGNHVRVKIAGIITMVSIWLSYLFGGWWYVVYYGVAGQSDKNIILAGPWKWAHTFFMEAKEHIFFMLLFLSILLPLVVFRNDIYKNKGLRTLTIVIALTIALLGLGMEGFGAMISKGIKISLLGGK